MSEPRGSTAPTWGDTHIYRINNWVGSNSWVEGARRDADDTPQPPADEPVYPYLLTDKVFVDGKICLGGNVVWLHPSVVGPHHQKVPGVKYPGDEETALLLCSPAPTAPELYDEEEEAPPCSTEPAEPELL